MIDPLKATKGRRMSKKTRKKSPKAPSASAPRAQSTGSAKTRASKTRKAAASKSGKKPSKKSVSGAAPGASHKTPSRPLRSSGRGESVLRIAAAESKAIASTPEAGSPPARKQLAAKPDASAAGKLALTEGAKAPAFHLPRDGGGTVSLADFSGRRLVVFFYPRADTPGCTKEAIDFTRLASAFDDSNTAILGVSADPPKTQEAFRDKHRLSTPLVSDEQHEMLESYGVWGEKSMYGKTFQGISRTTVLVGADGRIIRIWRNVKVDGHADEVLAAVRAL
jgi:thioredoxin-dependent peroxiredoxin